MQDLRLRSAVDDAVLRSVQRLVGVDAFADLLDEALAKGPMLCERITAAIAMQHPRALQVAVQELAVAVVHLGATRLPEICEEVEVYARAGDLDAALPLAGWVRSEYQAVHDHLEAVRSQGLLTQAVA